MITPESLPECLILVNGGDLILMHNLVAHPCQQEKDPEWISEYGHSV